jgi:S-adenosylmethionine decarboxylase proenzyme, Bacillus form
MSDDAALCEAAGLKGSAAVSAEYVYSGPELPHGAASGLDHFVVRNGVACAGIHLIIDLIGADHLDDIELIDRTLRECVRTAGATLLHMHLHHFTPNSGVSGVAVLAESHLSIHTWPRAICRSTPGRSAAMPPSMCSCAAMPDPSSASAC